MSIVFSRIYAYAKVNGVSMQPIEKRIEIGKLVVDAYREKIKDQRADKRFQRVKFIEDGKSVSVNYYPPEFTPEIDAIISNFYLANPVEPPPPKKERKRFHVKRPVASSKPISR